MTFPVCSQNTQDYFIIVKPGDELGPIQTTLNADQTLTLSLNNTSLASVLNAMPIFKFEKAFPSSQRSRLQRAYLMQIVEGTSLNILQQRVEIEDTFLIDQDIMLASDANPVFGVIPDDYDDLITGGRNTALDLIKAPLAWTMSTGENVLVGVSDSKIDINHEDLIGQIIDELNFPPNLAHHGTGVAGIIAGKTNNNKGIASLAHDSRIISAPSTGFSRVLALSQIPGVRVINCSWLSCNYDPIVDEMYQEISDNGVLVVAAAGNGPGSLANCGTGHGYAYPASYGSTLSVSSVGHRYPIGSLQNNLINPDNGNPYLLRSWKDVHLLRPQITGDLSSHTHNDKVDVVAPGHLYTNITDNYNLNDDYVQYPYGYWISPGGTSGATPFVTALAALIFSINPSLNPEDVKNIIKDTADDIYHIPYNQNYIGLLGSGRINAYRATLTAKCMTSPSSIIDLAMQNSDLDYFIEPDPNTPQPWMSKDIWVRNQNDGKIIDVHENPEYDANDPNYAYVRVTNNSCVTSSGNDTVKLYWAKANTSLFWPQHWDGSLFIHDDVTNDDVLMGDEIGTLTVPSLEIGESTILEFEWDMPNPEDYVNINENPWHFCLLARIVSNDDPMTFPEAEGSIITDNVINNNNIAWKNMTIVDFEPGVPKPVSSVVAVGNPFTETENFTLEFYKEGNEIGKPIYDEAEISITLDDVLYDGWNTGGKPSANFKETAEGNKIIVENNQALIENIQLQSGEIGSVTISFNFLTKELTNKTKYVYHLVQKDAVTNKVIGGETFEIRKKAKDAFYADAGGDEEIDKNESVTLFAGAIDETATYNWYDPEGNLISTGTDLTVSPDITKIYKLEVVSNVDGFKDYDEVQITVKPYKIESLVPNPTSSMVTINYLIDGVTSAYVMVVNTNTGGSDNYILDAQSSSTTLDLSTYTTGLYNIILVCDGAIQNSKNLIKQ